MTANTTSPRPPDKTRRRQPKARKLLVSVSAFALALAGSGVPGWQQGRPISNAYAAPDELFADLAPLGDEELDRQRGGFRVGNLDISIGVSVKSTIDGFAQVITNFSIPSPGEIVDVDQIVSSVPTVEVPDVVVPEVVVPEVPKIEVPDIGDVQKTVEESVTLALDAAKLAFKSPELGEKAELANSNNKDGVVNQPDTLGQISSAIETAQTAVSTALPAAQESLGGTGNHQAGEPDPVTLTAADASSSGKAASPSQHPLANANVVVSGPDAKSDTMHIVAAALGGEAEIVHRVEDGHLSIIRNTLDGVSVRQSVSVNLTVENFSQIQQATHLQRNLAAIARHIGVFSLRR